MTIYSATLVGVTPLAVEVEIDLSPGLPFFQIVGLPDAILKESKTRVKSAIIQGGFEFPYEKRVVLNLAPSKIKKEGSGLELGLAARILVSAGQIPWPDKNILCLGELALDGKVRSVPEIAALVFAAKSEDLKIDLIVVPREVLDDLPKLSCPVVAIDRLGDFQKPLWWEDIAGDDGEDLKSKVSAPKKSIKKDFKKAQKNFVELNFSSFWARHLEIAAIGKHHYLLCGSPGCGKTFFAEALKSLLEEPDVKRDGRLEVLDALFGRNLGELPWAAPHHSASAIGLLGGGNPIRPGAITRAHGGVLFLDELLEFPASVLDSLREPIESGSIEVFRAGSQVTFPSRFQLVAATNPCRCGFWKFPHKGCICRPGQRQLYQARLSGPFFDRFEVRVFCKTQLEPESRLELISGREIKKRVLATQKFLQTRQAFRWNTKAFETLDEVVWRQKMSYRRKLSLMGVAETLAALSLSRDVALENILEASVLQEMPELDQRLNL